MNWRISHRAERAPRLLADRHYSRQKPGTPQFVPPGRCLVLSMPGAYWVTSWPFKEYTKHEWAGAWVCSAFRNEDSGILSSLLVTEAVAATRWFFGTPPELGMVTFIDRDKTRKKRDPGRCFRRAAFFECGETKMNKLLALRMDPFWMPDAEAPNWITHRLFGDNSRRAG